MGNSPQSENTWFPEIDGLRTLCCAGVLLDHFNLWSPLKDRWIEQTSQVPRLFMPGRLGVELFFCISAFLMSFLACREYTRNERFSWRHFLIRRAFRIWPLFFLMLLVTGFVAGPMEYNLKYDEARGKYLFSVLPSFFVFLNNWCGFTRINELNIFWSIAVEEQFYVVFPLCILLSIKSRRMAFAALTMLWVGGIVFRLAHVFGFEARIDLYHSTVAHVDSFLFGALAGWAWSRGLSSRIRAFLTIPGLGPALLASVLVVGSFGKYLGTDGPPYRWYGVSHYTLLSFLFCAFLLWVLANPRSGVARFLRFAPMTAFGRLSYGIYLWHIIVQTAVLSTFYRYVPRTAETDVFTYLALFWVHVALTTTAAALTYLTIERPFLRLRRLIQRDSRSATRVQQNDWTSDCSRIAANRARCHGGGVGWRKLTALFR